MNSIVRFAGVLFAAAVLAFLSSCSRNNVQKSLNDIETYIDDRPDSALTALRTIDTLLLVSASSKAKYSLLSAIAYDKNYIDTTDVRVIEPAVEYYSRVNDKERLRKAYYYKGKMLEVADDRTTSAYYYSLAYDIARESENLNAQGLVCAALSRIYSYNRNSKQELLFAQKAEDCFLKDGDVQNAWIMQSIIPMCYANNYQWEISDSLYDAFFKCEIKDTVIYAKTLLKAAKTKIRKSSPDPVAACESFDRAIKMGVNPTVDNLSVYTYSLELKGEEQNVNSLLPVLDNLKMNPKNSGVVNLWEYRIFSHRKEFDKALSCFENSIAAQDSMLIVILGQSLEKVQKDYYIEKSSRLSAENKAQKTTGILILVISVFIVFVLMAIINKNRHMWIEKEEEVDSLKKDLDLMVDNSTRINDALVTLRKEYIQVFKEQFSILNDLGSAYWSPLKRSKKEKTLAVVINALNSFSEVGNLEATINSHLNNVMSRIRIDLPNMSEKTYQIICLFIIGFSPKTIAMLMNLGVDSVYTIKNRIKKRIASLESPNRTHYLELFT